MSERGRLPIPPSRETESVTVGKSRFVYSDAPLLVYWEITRACDLVCRHCRADAIKDRHVLELSRGEGEDLIEQMRAFGPRRPHLVVTGGDPLKRADVFDLVECAVGAGFPVSVAPSVTPNLTKKVLRLLKELGAGSIALSLDGSTEEKHDGVRGVPGCFSTTIPAIRAALDERLELQINSLVTAETVGDLPAIYELLKPLPLMRWKLFALIAVGRGQWLREITPEQCENLHHWLWSLSEEAPFPVATTEAPHFRRVAYEKMRAAGLPLTAIRRTPVGKGFGIRDGNGILFISHNGDVYPSGFLPWKAGNVRTGDIIDIYRNSPVFTEIRHPSTLKGKCGVCSFKGLCGGSRARAYAHTGDALQADPLCAYEPDEKEHLEDACDA